MNDRFDILWTNYLEGELDPSELSELRQLLESDQTLLKDAADSFRTHRLLGLSAHDSEERHEEFVRSTMAMLPAEETVFTSEVMNRLPASNARTSFETPAPMDPVRPGDANSSGNDGYAKSSKEGRSRVPYSLFAITVALLMLATYMLNQSTWFGSSDAQVPHLARVTSLNGVVQWTGGGGIVETIIEPRDIDGGTLESMSADAWAEIQFRDGSTITISGRSLLTLSEANQKVLRLRYGNLSADVAAQPAGHPMLLHTPSAELSVLGTQFNVDAHPDATTLVVNEGLVRLKRLADGKQVDVEARHGITASLGNEEVLTPTKRSEAVAIWQGDLQSDVIRGKWVSELWIVAMQLKKSVAEGRMDKAAAKAAFKDAASLDSVGGSVWAEPESFGSLIILSVSQPSRAPVILKQTARLRIRGRVYGSKDVQFGFSVNDRDGGFAGKHSITVSADALKGNENDFDIELPIADFQEVTHLGSDISGKELRDWWCVTDSRSSKLQITHVELLTQPEEEK